ncbi:1183_t:CDS:1, partial [Scutellospora calospora]
TESETSQTDETLENSSSNMEDLNSENLVVEKKNKKPHQLELLIIATRRTSQLR